MSPEKQLLIKNINNNTSQEGSGNNRQCQNINVYYFFFSFSHGPLHLNSYVVSQISNETPMVSESDVAQN